MVTVEKLLLIPALKGIRLIAGKTGLQRKVGHVTVMEVPDIMRWLKGNDLLITSFYAMKDNLPLQCECIQSLAHSSCAAIAVKTGQYIEEIPEEFKQIADECNFPLLEIPYELSYIDIIMNAMTYIFEEHSPRVVMEKYIKDIVFEAYTDEALMLERGKLIGCRAEKTYLALTVQFAAGCRAADPDMEALWRVGIAVAQFASTQRGLNNCIAVNTGSNSSILLDSENEKTLRRLIPIIEQEAMTQINYVFPGHKVYIGYGAPETGLVGIRRTYFDALRAIRSGQIFYPDKQAHHIKELDLEIAVEEIIGSKAGGFFQHVLDGIGSDDILQTLIKYYECGTDLDKTASCLFTHKNTVKYRLGRVKNLIGLDVKNFGDNVKLYMAVMALKIRGHSGF